ncbi:MULTISPECIES: hypothetical protein [Proteiniphilum]|jgi:hypothetical protein|uniref:hypothetical protein n=1 Tax=Proteiniphilum TaxID=294702 RepID=UPI001EEB0827|nr:MULTISPECIES: hypothetical protein [Proteiniphilum]ULB35785.1 hypothetical protein KDN43_07150 [Proteiniphilum propionicum]
MTKKNSIQIWVIALLVVLNLTTIGTIFYHNRQVKDNEAAVVIDESRAPLTGRYFRQTLRFDDEQMNAFRKANRQFQPQANLLIYEMDSLKTEMFIELNREQPDTIRLNSISDHIGRHHAELKKITNDFYLSIKSVCDSAQCYRLQETFLPLYRDETSNARRGFGYYRPDSTGGGYRHRYGRGWNKP